MSQVANTKHYNNLLATVSRNKERDELEHQMAKVPLDLKYKGQNPVTKNLTCGVEQINGKQYDIKYKPKITKSTPNYGFDEGRDPTILNAVRNKLVDVSGLLIPCGDLPKDRPVNYTRNPLQFGGIIF